MVNKAIIAGIAGVIVIGIGIAFTVSSGILNTQSNLEFDNSEPELENGNIQPGEPSSQKIQLKENIGIKSLP